MQKPSSQFARRFELTLNDDWADWFDADCSLIEPAGSMRCMLTADNLCTEAPVQIWPGFMLPDSLPVVGNDYGDWICVRITDNNTLGELIYWYHGGGDWIPVGQCLAEALLHDAIDQFRSHRTQMLRGAPESRQRGEEEVINRMNGSAFRSWLVNRLGSHRQIASSLADRLVQQVANELNERRSRTALELLYDQHLARDAVACDLIEIALQSSVEQLAQSEIADRIGVSWYPDYVCLLFDLETASPELRSSILACVPELDFWPSQAWDFAKRLADEVLSRRTDLGWATTVAGWARQRSGKLQEAQGLYWAGRHASSFGDQSVRLNSHGFAEHSGKFSIEQLLQFRGEMPQTRLAEPYFQLFYQPHSRSLLQEVHDYWWNQGLEQRSAGEYAAAYECFYRSGWDLGVSRLSDYAHILKALAESAKAAGWRARGLVAETHLACLVNR